MPVERAARPLVLQVRDGEVAGTGSWLYAWLDAPAGRVLYVGATGLPPLVRTWLHLHHEDPSIARAASLLPAAVREQVDVLAFPLPVQVERASAKASLIAALSAAGLLSEHYAGDAVGVPAAAGEAPEHIAAMVTAVIAHRS